MRTSDEIAAAMSKAQKRIADPPMARVYCD